jgi:hypothetical protein
MPDDDGASGVIDGRRFLSMPRQEAMREAGITSEADYARAYRDVEQVVTRRDNREGQHGRTISVVVKKSGTKVNDA